MNLASRSKWLEKRLKMFPEQLSVKQAIYALFIQEELEPQEFLACGLPAATPWSFQESRKVMDRCDGALILALIRSEFDLQDGNRCLCRLSTIIMRALWRLRMTCRCWSLLRKACQTVESCGGAPLSAIS